MQNTAMVLYIADIMHIAQDGHDMAGRMHSTWWEMNPKKIQETVTSIKFYGIH